MRTVIKTMIPKPDTANEMLDSKYRKHGTMGRF